MMKRVLTATALAAALAMPAFAQQPPANPATPPAASPANPPSANASGNAGFVQKQEQDEWRGSKLIGTSVYGPDNKSIGSIDDVIVAKNGQIKAVVIGVGGFLGVGQKDVAVPFEALQVSRKPDSSSIDKITVTFNKDQLQKAPTFAFYAAPSKQTTGAGGLNSLNRGSSKSPGGSMGK